MCIDAETIIKGVEEGQLAVRRALTAYAGAVPPTAVSDAPQSSSKASETESLDSLESLAAVELNDESESESSLEESGDDDITDVEERRKKLQQRYHWLVQQRAALQQQLHKLKQDVEPTSKS